MLALDYPDFTVIAVNDRSTDATGALLDGLAAQHPRLEVTHIGELPEGWLGKLNALATGVARCDGEWLLFMDADAHLGRHTVKRALTYAEQNGLDCLSVVPEVRSAGLVGDAVFNVSLAIMSGGGRLRKVRDPKSRHVAATGAFILVRKSHLRPDARLFVASARSRG
jgi:cellulose synthase/poly-beta-1,6-N-acetylglucosamine synthase-like glycosyltransferase